MHEKIAKITSTTLGVEDHGIFTTMLYVNYGEGGGQGIGGYALDEWDASARERRGTAYGMEFIARIMKAAGVDRWEKIQGRTVMVYFENDEWGATPLGLGPLPTEPGERFLFSDLGSMISS